jgi:hypothetical protein
MHVAKALIKVSGEITSFFKSVCVAGPESVVR